MLLLILAISFGTAVWFCTQIKRDTNDKLIATIIFLPAVLFLIESLELQQLTGPGFSATFKVETKKPVQSLARAGEIAEVSLVNDPTDFRFHSNFETCSEYYILRPALIPDFNSPQIYSHVYFATSAISSSIACGKFLGLVVLDDHGRYLGSFDRAFFVGASSLWTLLDVDEHIVPTELGKQIDQIAIFSAALKFPVQRILRGEGYTAAINQNATLGDAFTKFQEMEGTFLVVTDTLGIFQGILPRRKVESSLLRALVAT